MEVDKKILERLKKGDESAFESLFWQYNSHIYNFVLSILYDKSLAEDITQTVFSNKEIATRLSISEKTVETQIYRSLQFLREKLSSDVFLACFLIFLANRL